MLARLGPTGASRPPVRWVHLGIGAFFRAHGCRYLFDLGGWGVVGVSLRSPRVRDSLAPQDFVYTASELSADAITPRTIEVLRTIYVAPENPQAVIDAMSNTDIEIVSLTVTEKGYCHDPASGALNKTHPDIIADIKNPLPRSAPGFIVRALDARRRAGSPAFSVLSCDNLPDNGAVTKGVVTGLAAEIDPELADWITQNVCFPSSMVDRIVPATTSEDLTRVESLIGVHDAAPVMHEPFGQWVVEDRFCSDRPALDNVGVQFVSDVAPFEAMKLRMLNGAHSALAYLGALCGHTTVAAAMTDPAVSQYLQHLWQKEIIPTLTPPQGTDLADYSRALAARFANPGIAHSTHQIAMDGSQKLPQRLLGTIRDRLDKGQTADGLLLAVAAWMHYVGGADEAGNSITVQDPFADQLRAAHVESTEQTVRNILAMREIFDTGLAARIDGRLVELYSQLREAGGAAMMERVSR